MAPHSALSLLLCGKESPHLQRLADGLQAQGMMVTVEREAEYGPEAAFHRHFDAVVMEVDAAGRTCQGVCETIRHRSTVPLILLTPRWDDNECISALETGADDYVTLSVDPRLLVARIRVVLRRWQGWAKTSRSQVQVGPLTLNMGTQSASLHGRELALTGYEFALLRVLAERAGQVLGREELMELVKGNAEDAFDRSIDVHVCRIRAKLGADMRQRRMLRTVRGMGYLLTVTAGEDAVRSESGVQAVGA